MLKILQLKILNQVVVLFAYDHNWSTFEFIQYNNHIVGWKKYIYIYLVIVFSNVQLKGNVFDLKITKQHHILYFPMFSLKLALFSGYRTMKLANKCSLCIYF